MSIKNKYTLIQQFRLAYCVFRTKLICSKARIIRFPCDIRNGKYIDFGIRLTTGVGCRLEAYSGDGDKCLIFGSDVQINDYVHICAMESVSIGNGVLMASHIYISDNSHGCYKGGEQDSHPDVAPINRTYYTRPVRIEDHVWLAEHVVVMPGVTIGKGSIVGSNSVVTKDIPPYTIAVGQPARLIKKFNFETKTWEYID